MDGVFEVFARRQGQFLTKPGRCSYTEEFGSDEHWSRLPGVL